ncbi:MAG: BLUF domain-containing protein [Burkholderiaceae bacterium]|nr:MAG: BLUF domain-containing protein [Burkholderiaceae bacterium]
MLVRLLYCSRLTPGAASAQVLESILEQSRRNNAELGITGILCQGDDVFLQVLEGGRDEVNVLYRRLLKDPRHRDVTLMSFEPIAERRFVAWSMGAVNLHKLNPSLLLKHAVRPRLDPYDMQASAALALLEELMANAAIVGRGN